MKKATYLILTTLLLSGVSFSCDGPEAPIEPLPSFEDSNYRIGYWLGYENHLLDTFQFVDETHLIRREGNLILGPNTYEVKNDTLYVLEPGFPYPFKYPYEFNSQTGILTLYFEDDVLPSYNPSNYIKLW